MIGYVTVGTNNLERAMKFFDAVLGEIGARRMMESDQFVAWAASPEAPGLVVKRPLDGNPATVGNGVMVALKADSPGKVNAMYKKALKLGGKDDGAPVPGGEHGFYAGYFRDLDGNKFNAFCVI